MAACDVEWALRGTVPLHVAHALADRIALILDHRGEDGEDHRFRPDVTSFAWTRNGNIINALPGWRCGGRRSVLSAN